MATSQTGSTRNKPKATVVDGWSVPKTAQKAINASKSSTAEEENIPQWTPEKIAAIIAEATKNIGKPAPKAGGGPNALDRYTRQLQGMLTKGSYNKPFNNLESKLNELYGQAQPRISDAMTNLETTLKGMQNPYSGFQAQTTQVTPELSQLLQSQGVPTNPLQELAAVTAAQNAGQSTAFGNLASTLGNIYGANQQGMIQDVGAQRADLTNALEQSRLGFGSQIANQRMDQQSSLMKQLLDAIAKGGRPNAGRLF